LFYPLKFTCFDKIIWATTIDSNVSHGKRFELWSKAGATPNYRVEDQDYYVLFLICVPNLINTYFFFKVTDTLLSILIIIVTFSFIFIINKNRIIKIVKKKIIFEYLYCLIFVLFLIWFFKHPDLRYGGYPLLALLFFVPLSIFFSKFIKCSINNEIVLGFIAELKCIELFISFKVIFPPPPAEYICSIEFSIL
jgi:hypothetical protein